MMEVLAEAILSRPIPYTEPQLLQQEDDVQRGRGFNISFTWDHDQGIEESVLHTVDLTPEFNIASVVEGGVGSILSRPSAADVVPCELHLSSWRGYHFTMVSVVSESKHVELYVEDAYETTSKGERCDASLDVLYVHQLHLAPQNQMSERLTLKFLSLGSKESMRLQAVVVGVARQPNAPQRRVSSSSSTDMDSVRELIKSMNMEVGSGAEKLMNDIKSQQLNQKQMMFQQLLQNGNSSQQLNNHRNEKSSQQSNDHRNENNESNNMVPNLLSHFQTLLTSPGLSSVMSGLSWPQNQLLQQQQEQQQRAPINVSDDNSTSIRTNDCSSMEDNSTSIRTNDCSSMNGFSKTNGHNWKAETLGNNPNSLSDDGNSGTRAVCSPCSPSESNNESYSRDNTYRSDHIHPSPSRRQCNVNGNRNGVSHNELRSDVGGCAANLGVNKDGNGFHHQKNGDIEAGLSGINGSRLNGGDSVARCSCCGCCCRGSISEELSRGFEMMERNLKSHIDTKIDLLLAHLNKRLDDSIK